MASRPRVLVERELQARIEAQTASGFRQRRRAAKAARRIAALPPSLFDAAGALIGSGNGSWGAASTPNPVVIDLPMSAIHDVRPVRVESETVRVHEPEPLALVAPVIDIVAVDAVESEPETDIEPETEPKVDAAPDDSPPGRAQRRHASRVEHRWRLRRPSRFDGDDTPIPSEAESAPLVAATELAEPAAVESEPELIVAPEPGPEPTVAEPEAAAAIAGAEPEPLVSEPEPEPIVAAAPKPQPARERKPAPAPPRGAADWRPSTSLWARQVFNSHNQPQPVATWPRPYEPPAPDELAPDYIDAEVAETARTD